MDVPNIQFLLIVGNHPVTIETQRLTFSAKFKGFKHAEFWHLSLYFGDLAKVKKRWCMRKRGIF